MAAQKSNSGIHLALLVAQGGLVIFMLILTERFVNAMKDPRELPAKEFYGFISPWILAAAMVFILNRFLTSEKTQTRDSLDAP